MQTFTGAGVDDCTGALDVLVGWGGGGQGRSGGKQIVMSSTGRVAGPQVIVSSRMAFCPTARDLLSTIFGFRQFGWVEFDCAKEYYVVLAKRAL